MQATLFVMVSIISAVSQAQPWNEAISQQLLFFDYIRTGIYAFYLVLISCIMRGFTSGLKAIQYAVSFISP
jgi:hypothetical protein